ncbi:MAG: hypothetical protein H3C35_07390 [Bacteroidetes bacterium]|nr:hypothetical protein [Bacteroidota bacterium]
MLVQVILVQQVLFAGFDRIPQPTNVFAKAFSGVALLDENAFWINPASIAQTQNVRSTLFYSPSMFQLPQLANTGIVCTVPFSLSSIGIGVSTFGFSLYRETVASVAYGTMVTKYFTAGAAVNLYHLSITNYGTNLSVGADLGAIINPFDNFTIGIAIQNINRPKVGSSNEEIPLLYSTGFAYNFSQTAVINVDFVKDIRYPLDVRGGIDILLHEYLILRGGISSATNRMFGGMSIPYSFLRIDYGFAAQRELGTTHSFGISFSM